MSGEYTARLTDSSLREMVSDHPVILLMGPRTTGKTTTARRFAATVISLTERSQAEAFRLDPAAVLRGKQEPILIDE